MSIPETLIIEQGVLKKCICRDARVCVPEGVHTIGQGAFKGSTLIETIVLPDSVTTIMDNAFKGCRKLKEITLPPALKFLGDYAFHRCHSLRFIDIPQSVKALGNCVFLYCDSLEEVRMPGVKSLGLQVFLNDVKLKSLHISTELNMEGICDCFTSCSDIRTITMTDGSVHKLQNVVAAMSPESGFPPLIRTIAADVCSMMEIQNGTLTRFLTNIKEVDVAEGIRAIGKSSFFDKRGIVSVTFPESLEEIGSRAFRNCINLESVTFHGDKAAIARDAFKNCSSLRLVRTGGAEYELKGLDCLSDSRVPAFVREIHSQVLGNFTISGTTLIRYGGSEARVVVPDGVTAIGERAFAGNEAIDRVVLPETVTAIGEEAFADCLLLQTINLPEGLAVMEKGAFEGCVKLIRAILPDALTSVSESAFKRCRVLNEVRIGPGVKEIGPMAFYGCRKLGEAALPEGLELLGDMAFYQCMALKEVRLPASIHTLGGNVFTFSGVQRAEVCCTPKVCKADVFSQCARLKTLVFQEGVTHVGDKFAFQCEKLASVVLPSTVKTVGRHAFEGTRYLKELPAPKMAGSIFLDGSGMSGSVTLAPGTTAVAGGAFYGNVGLTSIELPDSVTYLGPGAFGGCSGLEEISLPPGVTNLEEGVFCHCTSLKSVRFQGESGRIARIHRRAFAGCPSLERVPSLQSCDCIGEMAFDGCVSLKQVEGLETAVSGIAADTVWGGLEIGDAAFRGTGFLDKKREKDPLVILRTTVVCGSACQGDITIPEGVTDVGDYAFYGNHAITSVSFPQSLKSVGRRAFSACTALAGIYFQGPAERMGEGAFEKCAGLTEITIDAQTIGRRAFAWCTSLEAACCLSSRRLQEEAFCGCSKLQVWEGRPEEIGCRAFSGCESLEAFPLSAAKRIEARAFERCDGLERISLPGTARIGAHAFEDCGRLKTVELCLTQKLEEQADWGSEEQASWKLSLGSCGFSGATAINAVIINGRKWELTGYASLFDQGLPQVVKQIYASALGCFTIDENCAVRMYHNNGRFLVIPDGVKEIEGQVFQDRSRLEEIDVPGSVEGIGPRAFDKTGWLKQQRGLCSGLPVIVNRILIDGESCRGEVEIPEEVTMVDGWAFAGNLDLTGVTFRSPYTKVGEHAFRNCINLKQIILADGRRFRLEGLKTKAAELPPAAARIVEDCYNCFKTTEAGVLAECTGNISRMVLPEGITAIGDGAFQDSNLLTSVQLAPETKAIGAHGFEQCKWLEVVYSTSQVRRIGDMAFSGCIRLRRLEDLSGLSHLGQRAFENCTSLEEIILPEGLEEIPRRAFFRCHRLKRVHLPSTLKRIGEEAFAFCYELPLLQLPEDLEIGSRAFAWCHGKEDRL